MAVSIGNGRYYKLFPGNAPPERVLIQDLSEPGLLSNAFVQGIVVKVCPIKTSERYGKLCKMVLKEDVEKPTRNSPCAVINTFLLGDLADEGSRICEGDRVVLSEVIVECSPTGEHQFQLIAWREKSQASIWVINSKGKVRANVRTETVSTSSDEIEEPDVTKTAGTFDHSADSDEEEHILFESCEYDFSKSTSADGQGVKQTKQKYFEKRKGKFHLGQKGVTPSTSHVKRSVSDLVVVLDKGEAKAVMKTLQEDEYYTKSRSTNVHSKAQPRRQSNDSCKNASTNKAPADAPNASAPNANASNASAPNANASNASAPNANASNASAPNANASNASAPSASAPNAGVGSNANANRIPTKPQMPSIAVETGGQTMIMSQKAGPGGAGSLSLSIQSANPDQPSNIHCTHIELTPSGVSTRIWNGDPHGVRDQSQTSAIPSDLPQLMAPEPGSSSSKACEEDTELKSDDPKDNNNEDSVMPDFELEEHVFKSARRLSSSSAEINRGHQAGKGLPAGERNTGIPHHLKLIDEDLIPSTSVKSMIPDDYTPASSLLASQDSSSDKSGKRSPVHPPVDPKRLKTSPGPSHLSPDRAGRNRKRSSRAAADYAVPPGYTTLANLQPETTVNVYGVVKLFKPAWKCRGTDMCSVLVLMDPTIAESSTGLECVAFQPSVSRLPAVHKIGDIVRLHRIKISQYQGRLQAKSTRGFAAIVFDRDTKVPVTAEMARVSSSTFTLTHSDKETIESLKNWCEVHPVLFPPSNSVTVSQINPDTYFDLTCQVLGVALHRTLDCVVLYVTDGSQPKHDLRKCAGDEYNVVEPLCNRSSQDDDVISVFLYGSHAEVARLLVRKGGYIILHNVHSQVLKPGGSVCSVLDVVKPYLELCVHRGTAFGRGLSVLSPDSPEVKQLKRQLGL